MGCFESKNLTVSETYFSQIANGTKSVEGRALDEKRSKIQVGDIISIKQREGFRLPLKVQIIRKTMYAPTAERNAFCVMLNNENLADILPSTPTVAAGVLVYNSIYKNWQGCAVAFELRLLH